MNTPRWYMLNKMGMATLCSDKDDAEKEAADAQMAWPHMGPHRAVQLVEAADVEALRAGYEAARLEIESLKAQLHAVKQINAAQFGLLAASIPGSALRASHGQAAAQAAPAYKDSTPELHVGGSAFESWYSTYSPAHKGDKQRARDAYAAGMGDPLVTAAPAAVAVPTFKDFCKRHGLDPKKMDGHGGMWARVALDECRAITTQSAPHQEVQEPVAWYVTGCGRLLDEDEAKAEARHIGGTARAIPLYTAPQPSPAAQGDAQDAARLDWLALAGPTSICVVIDRPYDGEVEVSTDDVTGYGKTLREALDAARKQGGAT